MHWEARRHGWDMIPSLVTVFFLLLSELGMTFAQNETDSDGGSSSIGDGYMALITISILMFAFLVGGIVAYIAEYLNTRTSLRDDASDMSDYTKNMLKMQYMYAFNKKEAEKMESSIDKARRYAKMWRAKAAAVKVRAIKASKTRNIETSDAKAPRRVKGSPLPSPRNQPATIQEVDETENPSSKKGDPKTTVGVHKGASSTATQNKAAVTSTTKDTNSAKSSSTSKNTVTPSTTQQPTSSSSSKVTSKSGPTLTADGTFSKDKKLTSASAAHTDASGANVAKSSTTSAKSELDASVLPEKTAKTENMPNGTTEGTKSPASSSGDFEFLASEKRKPVDDSPESAISPVSSSAVQMQEIKGVSTTPKRPPTRAKSASGNKKAGQSRPLSGAVTPGLRPKSGGVRRPVSGKSVRSVKVHNNNNKN